MAELGYSRGTWRACPPAETLDWTRPHWRRCGITRCADVTGLDNLGLPVVCAIRPDGRVLQVSNGKGLTPEAARASAVMEAIELYHAENPPADGLVWSAAADLPPGEPVLRPADLPGAADVHWGDRRVLPWIRGRDAHSGEASWAPASFVFFDLEPAFFVTSTNGLASGNTPEEARLHALFEIIERHDVSSLREGGKLRVRERCRAVDPSVGAPPELGQLAARAAEADSVLRLLEVPSEFPVHTFWAVLLNRSPFDAVASLNVGFGTHVDPVVAACRAVTEAAQSRATFIHGSREDLREKKVFGAHQVDGSPAYRYFLAIEPRVGWDAVEAGSLAGERDLGALLAGLLSALASRREPLYFFDLTRPTIGIPVVRAAAPRLRFALRLF